MKMPLDFERLQQEHVALTLEYGRTQRRVSQMISEQAATIQRLEAQAMVLRAAVIARDSALAWAHEDYAAFETSLVDADLVICQTGCVSDGAYWRVKDYCKRTGKQCVLVERPDALDRVRASRSGDTVPDAVLQHQG